MNSDVSKNVQSWLRKKTGALNPVLQIEVVGEEITATVPPEALFTEIDREFGADVLSLVQAAHNVNIRVTPLIMRTRAVANISKEELLEIFKNLSEALKPFLRT